MPHTHIAIVRHAESTGNVEKRFTGWLDLPLSPRGELQARAAGRSLRGFAPLTAVYSSDLLRARQTAYAIADEVGFCREEIRLREGLRERSPGVLTGLTFQEAEERHPELYAALLRRDWDFVAPEGETNELVSARVGAVLEEVLREHRGGRVLLVSHGVAIAHLLRLVLGIRPEDFPRRVAFATGNTAIHRLTLREDGGWVVGALNDTAHLSGAEG